MRGKIMTEYLIYYGTNRRHQGSRWQPTGYGIDFSADGLENLRFGEVIVAAPQQEVQDCLRKEVPHGHGDGEALADLFLKRMQEARGNPDQADAYRIRAFEEHIAGNILDKDQLDARYGSAELFGLLEKEMQAGSDVLVYIHGFNVAWDEAVAAALALQEMVNRPRENEPGQPVRVVLFSWPSDGLAIPWVSYQSDRAEAKASGGAVGRAVLKLRDRLMQIKVGGLERRKKLRQKDVCNQSIHLLCHSMGNFVLRHAVERMAEFTAQETLPRVFDQVFLCAPDVDEDVLESGRPLGKLHQMARNVSIYHNRGDVALAISDHTKGNPDRLGHAGAAHPGRLHPLKVHQVDCSGIVTGLVEHSYYLWGKVNRDVALSIARVSQADSQLRGRTNVGGQANLWAL